MSRKYQDILPELLGRASKKSRISGKQLLILIRELCFQVSSASDRQWLSPLIQIIQSVTDSDMDLIIIRICLYLVTSSLLTDSWEHLEKDRATLLKEVLALTRHELSNSGGSKACLLWRTFGSLVAATADGAYMLYVSDSIAQLRKNPKGQKQKIAESDIKNWSAQLSALRRIVAANGNVGAFSVPIRCMDAIFTASGSKNGPLAQHGSALLFLTASYNSFPKDITATKGGVESYEKKVLAKDLIAAFYLTQKENNIPNSAINLGSSTKTSLLNLIDPLTCSHILQTVKVLTQLPDSEEIPEEDLLRLNTCCVKLLSHPRYVLSSHFCVFRTLL